MINVLKLQTIHLVVEVFFGNCKIDEDDVMSKMTIMVMNHY